MGLLDLFSSCDHAYGGSEDFIRRERLNPDPAGEGATPLTQMKNGHVTLYECEDCGEEVGEYRSTLKVEELDPKTTKILMNWWDLL